ncbi:hypothetical protein C8Q80DRAFT_1189889 [Daedaleopsis nitida]|nr:hypothetical protein C8Q80DRAFT_1189889 [Daedaleopsis nitida]
MASAHLSVPLDIFDHICEHLDTPTLRDVSLTCHGLVTPARTRLFRMISLGLSGKNTVERFAHLLTTSPSIGAFVRHLSIIELGDTADFSYALSFTPLSNLRSLCLRALVFPTMDDFFHGVLHSIPTLKTLICLDLSIDSVSPEPRSSPSPAESSQLAPSPRRRAIPWPALDALTIGGGSFDHTAFLRRLLDTCDVSCLSSLMLSFGATDRLYHWMPAVDAAHYTLKTLSMTISDEAIPVDVSPRGASMSANPCRYAFDRIAKARRLSKLVLEICPDTGARLAVVPTSAVLDALCTLLERTPPPFPGLSSLKLHVLHRCEMLDEAECASARALARPLADRARYPAFASLTVEVCPQAWRGRGDYGIWYPSWGAVNEDVLECRWRGAFGAVEEAEGAVLHIEFPMMLSPRSARARRR